MLLFAIFADFTFVAAAEVPDWSMSVDIGSGNLTNNFIHRFEVSPEHSSGKTTHTVWYTNKWLRINQSKYKQIDRYHSAVLMPSPFSLPPLL